MSLWNIIHFYVEAHSSRCSTNTVALLPLTTTLIVCVYVNHLEHFLYLWNTFKCKSNEHSNDRSRNTDIFVQMQWVKNKKSSVKEKLKLSSNTWQIFFRAGTKRFALCSFAPLATVQTLSCRTQLFLYSNPRWQILGSLSALSLPWLPHEMSP